ncbi:MAG: mechanosensitive ion channel family protein [Treponemataceae bacterium]|nr:mechanosensitive ion channel family protein [Treponemataceae bacterium]
MNETAEVVEETASDRQIQFFEKCKEFFTPEFLQNFAIVVGAVVVLCLLYIALKKIFTRIPDEKLKPQIKNVILKILKYLFEIIAVIYVLNLLGINLNALFGAAGIAGIAIGLAAQTSLGNVISGFFIIQEHVFKIGDHIRVNGVEGNVQSIGFLSVKIKTFDNQIVRVPNETLIKSNVENFSSMANRRICFFITVPNETDFADAFERLEKVVQSTDLVLKNPKSSVACAEFVDAGTSLRIIAWCKYADYLQCKSNLIVAVNTECAKAGIKIQYPVVEITGELEK